MQQVLLLSRDLAPVKTISWQRAITLLSLGKVEVVESYDGFVRSSTLVIKMPAVVRLLNLFRRNKHQVKFSRTNIFARDGYKCQYCGDKFDINELTYDHVTPRSQGGKTCWENIASCCSDCNLKKANRTPEQARMKLLKTPIKPKWIPAIQIQLSSKAVPDQWRSFLYWNTELVEG